MVIKYHNTWIIYIVGVKRYYVTILLLFWALCFLYNFLSSVSLIFSINISIIYLLRFVNINMFYFYIPLFLFRDAEPYQEIPGEDSGEEAPEMGSATVASWGTSVNGITRWQPPLRSSLRIRLWVRRCEFNSHGAQ